MAVGSFGPVNFETSDQKILNFRDFRQSVGGRWSRHQVIGCRPLAEFNGPDFRKVSFSILLDAAHGIRPRKTLELLEEMTERGQVETLVIGCRRVGKNRFKLTGISEAWNIIYSGGELARASVSLSLEEYL